jgi:hypothetical protein
MKELLKTKGGHAVWDLMDECNGFLEAITYAEEVDEADKIGFFPNDTVEEHDLLMELMKLEPYFPTSDCPHYGGVKVEIVTAKGVGSLTVLLDMNDLFSYQYVQRDVQLDYGRFYRGDMQEYLTMLSNVLNSPRALKLRKLFKKE